MDEEQFIARSRALLDERAEHLDAATLARLHVARNRAVAQVGRWSLRRLIWPGTGLAATAALLTVMVLTGPTHTGGTGAVPLDDLELIVSVDDPAEFEDLEFYGWLAANPDAS